MRLQDPARRHAGSRLADGTAQAVTTAHAGGYAAAGHRIPIQAVAAGGRDPDHADHGNGENEQHQK